jgi:hypothetical protein
MRLSMPSRSFREVKKPSQASNGFSWHENDWKKSAQFCRFGFVDQKNIHPALNFEFAGRNIARSFAR